MIIIHAMEALPRLAAAALAHAASVMPVTVITGARQTGKSTLVRDLAPAGERPYFTLDDLDVLEQASDAPDDLVARAERLTLDEVQRAPQLLLAVKRAVDRRRRAGRFLLTGSANLLLMHQVSETLAGRATYLTLWPMTRREQRGMGRAGIWQELLDAKDHDGITLGRLLQKITVPRDPGRIPLASVSFNVDRAPAAVLLRRNLLIYGLGGILAPFVGIKLIDVLVAAIHLA